MLFVKSLSVIAFIGSLAWFIAQPDYEPAIAIVTSLSTLIATWFIENKKRRQPEQNQTVAANGIGIQAGGDVHTGKIISNQKTKNAE